jgi:hypothetical protein
MLIDMDKLDVAEGENIRGDCPRCGGKNTFTATKRDGKIIYNCYKLSCDARGSVSYGMTAEEMSSYFIKPLIETGNINNRIEPFVYPEHVVSPANNRYLNRFRMRWQGMYAETLKNIELLYDVKDKRAVFPLYQDGILVDAIGRELEGAVPKWLRYGKSAEYAKYCYGIANSVFVLVEDVISAITVAKVWPGVTGFALLGTNLTDSHKQCLSEDARYVIVALDPDAMRKTLIMRKEIEAWCDIPTRAIRLRDDIKYQDDEDVNFLGRWINEAKRKGKQEQPDGEGFTTTQVPTTGDT